MAHEDTLMRKALKKILVPVLRDLRFVGKGWEFQRHSSSLDLLSVQFWKHGGRFVLEAVRQPRGDLHSSWGEVFPEAQLTVAHIFPHLRARQGPADDAGSGWFAFSGFGDDYPRYEALARQVTEMLPQLEHWLNAKGVGANVRPLGGAQSDGA